MHVAAVLALGVFAEAWPPLPAPLPRAAQLKRLPRMRRILAQNDWSIGVDPHSGQTYYYNQQTGQSQWELPIGLGGAQQQGNLQQPQHIDRLLLHKR